MSIIYLLILIIVFLALNKNYEKTVILYAPFKLMLHRGILLYDGSMAIILDMVISAFVLLLYMTRRNKYRDSTIPNFIVLGGLIFCIGEFIHGLNPRFALNIFFYEPIATFTYAYVLFKIIRNKEQLSQLIKGFMIVGAILVIDAVIDVTTGYNIITEIEKTQGGNRLWISENDVNRAGMARTTSFMPHSIAMGNIAVFIWGIVITIMLRYPEYIKTKKSLLYFVLIGLPVCMLFANSRTTILTAICFAPFFLKKKMIFSKMGMVLFIAVLGIIAINYSYFEWMYNSIFNESSVDVGGSTTDLRERQFDIALYYFLENPLTGKGVDFNVLDYENQNDAMGMESVWFILFMLKGLVGVVSYVYFILTGFVSFLKYNKTFWLFTLAWLVSITFSSQEGVSLFLYCIFILMSYKIYTLNEIFQYNTESR